MPVPVAAPGRARLAGARPHGRNGSTSETSILVPSIPRPATVRYNDWRHLDVVPRDAFRPTRPISVIVPYYEAPEALALTLAALEGQTLARDRFEVIVVDDGSRIPLQPPAGTPLDARVVRQERRGFGLARARNTGARVAAHDIFLFLDGDMLLEAESLAAYARWHHAVSDAVTTGFCNYLAVDGVDAATIRNRAGSLRDLFAGREADPSWIEPHMTRTGDMTSADDDLFRFVEGANIGIGRGFFELLGGFDESFTRWGFEDTEFVYRALVRGGILVPVRDPTAWHQGRLTKDRGRRARNLQRQRGKAAHLIAHPAFRDSRPGRTYDVPGHVVTIAAGDAAPCRLVEVAERVLADRVYDLLVRIEMPERDERRHWLQDHFAADARVHLAAPGQALEEYPAAPFHVVLPPDAVFARGIVHRLRSALGAAVLAGASLPDGSRVSIARAWAFHRARRTGMRPEDFGDVVHASPRRLRIGGGPTHAERFWILRRRFRRLRVVLERMCVRMVRIRTPAQAWWFLVVLAGAVTWKLDRLARPGRGVEPGAMTGSRERLDSASSAPAVDVRIDNPIGWVRAADPVVGALGSPACLPPGVEAHRIVSRHDRAGLRWIHHLEDVQAYHRGVIERARELARLAALGVIVHLADREPRLRAMLGPELHALMTTDVPAGDPTAREALSIRMRRAALREHGWSHGAEKADAAVSPPAPWPLLVSILLVTRRPDRLPGVLAAVERQTYPRIELVLGLHGAGFADAHRHASKLSVSWKAVTAGGAEPLGAVLSVAAAAASGRLLAKMDDDDLYGDDHIWDLVLAHQYSQAQLVGKGAEFVYLAGSNRTLHVHGGGESYLSGAALAGGTLLIARRDLERAGGWPKARQAVDLALRKNVVRNGGRVYRTHGAGFVLVRHGRGHTWKLEDDYFLARADTVRDGWDEGLARLADIPPSAGPNR